MYDAARLGWCIMYYPFYSIPNQPTNNPFLLLPPTQSLTALRAKLDEYDEVDRVTREADERMVELCDNLAR